LSPRLAALQGAVYLLTWNGGVIRGLRMERNRIVWNPSVASAATLVNNADFGAEGPVFTNNRIESSTPYLYRSNAQFAPAANAYLYSCLGEAQFTLGDQHNATLSAIQSAGKEQKTTLECSAKPDTKATSLVLEGTLDLTLDADGLLSSSARAQLMVLHSLAAQYGPASLVVTLHWNGSHADKEATANALIDLSAAPIHFDHEAKQPGLIRLLTAEGHLIEEWHGFQNAATLGGAVRARLGVPKYSEMPQAAPAEEKQ